MELRVPGFVRCRETAQGFQVFSSVLEECVWGPDTHYTEHRKEKGFLGRHPLCSPWPSQEVPSEPVGPGLSQCPVADPLGGKPNQWAGKGDTSCHSPLPLPPH